MLHSCFGIPSESIKVSSHGETFTAKIGITDGEIFQIHVSPAFEMSLHTLTEILDVDLDSHVVGLELIKTPSATLMIFRIERDGCLALVDGTHALSSCPSIKRIEESLQGLVDTLASIECNPW